MSVSYKPQGYASVTPYLIVDGAADAILYYKEAFGAEEVMRMPMGERIAHAEIRIGDSHVMLADEHPEMDLLGPESRGGATASLMIYVEDADAVFAAAIEAGASEEKALQDQFYGDRSGTLIDPFGQRWTIATHVEDVAPEEMQRRMAELGDGGAEGEAGAAHAGEEDEEEGEESEAGDEDEAGPEDEAEEGDEAGAEDEAEGEAEVHAEGEGHGAAEAGPDAARQAETA